MELNKEYTRERSISVDGVQSSADYTLADYQGDVRKILLSTATLTEGGRFHNADTLECVGTVTYKIVYIDSEGRITPVSFTSDYEMSAKCPGESYIDSSVRSEISNFSLRLMGPRRFSARCAIESDISVLERASYSVEGDGAAANIEVRRSEVSVSSLSLGVSEERELAEELVHLDGAIVDEVSLLISSAEADGLSAVITPDGVQVKAQICVRALVGVGSDMPHMYECSLELSVPAPMDAMPEDAVLVPSVSILSENITALPSEDGVSVVVNIIASASVRAEGNTEVSLLKDCFSTEREVDLSEGEFAYTERVGAKQISEHLGAAYKRAELGAENIRNVLYESARVKTEEVEPYRDGVRIKGSVQVSAVACEIAEDGSPAYAPLRFEVPFDINVNLNGHIPANSRCSAHLTVEAPHIDLEDDMVRFGAELTGYISVYSDRREPCISAVMLSDEPICRDPSIISVYYPALDESLFDVAKRFHTTPMDIARANELTEAVSTAEGASLISSGISYLLIK